MLKIKMPTITLAVVLVGFIFLTSGAMSDAVAKTDRPNILVLFGQKDDYPSWKKDNL